jgi:hypothetical protein
MFSPFAIQTLGRIRLVALIDGRAQHVGQLNLVLVEQQSPDQPVKDQSSATDPSNPTNTKAPARADKAGGAKVRRTRREIIA